MDFGFEYMDGRLGVVYLGRDGFVGYGLMRIERSFVVCEIYDGGLS